MTTFWAPVITTAQFLVTRGTTQRGIDIASHSFIHSLPARASSFPLQWAITTFPSMTPFATHMLPTTKSFLTWHIAPKISITTISLFLTLTASALIHTSLPAWRAIALVTNFTTLMNATIQQLIATFLTGKVLEPTSADIPGRSAKALGLHELRAAGARTGVTKQQARVSTEGPQGPITQLTTRMRQDPRIITRRILYLATVTKVRFWDLGLGVLAPAFRAAPGGSFRGLVGGDGGAGGGTGCGGIERLAGPGLDAEEVEDREAEGGARPGGVGGPDALEADEARQGAGGGGGKERPDLREVDGGRRVAGELEVGFENGVREVHMAEGVGAGGGGVGVGVGVGEELVGMRARGGGRHFGDGGTRSLERSSSRIARRITSAPPPVHAT